MQFTKLTPARKTTFTAQWVKKEFTKYTEMYRTVRARARKKMDRCFMCREKFEDGQVIGLACFEGVGNETLCSDCADKLLGQQADIGKEKS